MESCTIRNRNNRALLVLLSVAFKGPNALHMHVVCLSFRRKKRPAKAGEQDA